MKNYIQNGNVLTLTAPTGGVVSGLIYIIGVLIAVATTTEAQTLPFEGIVGGGVFEFPKTSANTPVEGGIAYWDDTAEEVTTTASGNTAVGHWVSAYLNGDTLAQVRLSGN